MTPKTVLLADDDRELVEALAARCLELGVKVEVAYDARTALRCICESRPDVICLDVKMPSGSGLSVCEMLVNDVELAQIPVIMLTGMTDEETIRRCHRMGAYYVLKSENVWQRLCPILCELLGQEPPAAHPFEPRDAGPGVQWQEEPARRGLNHLVEAIARQPVSLPEGASDSSPGPIRPCAARKPEAGPAADIGAPLHCGPVAPGGTPQHPTNEPTTTASQDPGKKRWTVLHIEDDADASDAMKLRLESLGLDILQAFDAAEGYRLAIAKSPDLVVCDYGPARRRRELRAAATSREPGDRKYSGDLCDGPLGERTAAPALRRRGGGISEEARLAGGPGRGARRGIGCPA